MRAARFARAFAGAIFGSWTSGEGRRRKPLGEVRRCGGSLTEVAEALEQRRLFAVTASLNTSTHVLTVAGDSAANEIRVYQQDYLSVDQITVQVVGQGLLGPWDAPDVALIRVIGWGGNDDIRFGNSTYGVIVSTSGMPVGAPAEVEGKDGDDTVLGTDHDDDIFGDGGNDDLSGAGGDDVIFGGHDDSDPGSDTLTGDSGNDTLDGDGGNDVFFAQDNEADYLDGGDGSDTAAATDGLDTLFNIEF